MRHCLVILCISLVYLNADAQKTANNPDCISSIINGKVTKVELSDIETVLHFQVKDSVGNSIAIPRKLNKGGYWFICYF